MERTTQQINNYLDLSPRLAGSSSPINFERAPTPGFGSFTPKPFNDPTPPTHYYASPPKHYQPDFPQEQQPQQHQPHEPTQQEHDYHHQEEEPKHEPYQQEHPQETPHQSAERAQRKRRQDDDQSFHLDEQEESSLSEPPSEPEPPLEPQPKRAKVKKTAKKIKQVIQPAPVQPKLAELIDHESPENEPSLDPPQPLSEPVTLPPVKSTLTTKSNGLSNLSFKRKQGAQKRSKTKPLPPSKNKDTPTAKPVSKRPAAAPEVQEELDTAENHHDHHDLDPPNSNHQSPPDHSPHQSPEPAPSNGEPKQQQPPPPPHPEPTQDPTTPNLSKPKAKTASNPTPNPSHKNPLTSSQNPPQTTTKKPVKPSFKKTNKPPASLTGLPASLTASATTTPKSAAASLNQARKKTGEYNLNDPTTWGALFGGGDKKPAAKPVKPGNLPPQASLFNGTVGDRLEARKKQRAEEKRMLREQMHIGFDLLRQNISMMDFEIEYKNHVRFMVDQPLGAGYVSVPTEARESPSGEGWPHPTAAAVAGASGNPPPSVLRRADGYKRYIQPLPPSSAAPQQVPPPSQVPPPPSSQSLAPLSHQPPGPVYFSSFAPNLPKKTLPRPGMFGSSFFIWQPPHLP
ncbi:hypothetical protein PCANC_20408 [Puccinia coronata f. sp. avenae]|uniref:Uncharacterized protein n=1 Tax=Puccinia coronata f. sp. avenae TaxID=200324 RepID=A0A2N5VES5_9BASI|nr:hypothetical protein PCANC_20408 [Puccinia coronata f. sp. avenae]PLW48497.1 hypothetical protein PCASD_04263 [Puccinia coronata f. sp. avenae]